MGSAEGRAQSGPCLGPSLLAASLAGIWTRVGVPTVAQFDNHANFRGGIQPAWQYFSPIVATCLDLGVTPRFIPVREPSRNGVIVSLWAFLFNDGYVVTRQSSPKFGEYYGAWLGIGNSSIPLGDTSGTLRLERRAGAGRRGCAGGARSG